MCSDDIKNVSISDTAVCCWRVRDGAGVAVLEGYVCMYVQS